MAALSSKKVFPKIATPRCPAFTALAKELGVWLLIGSLAIKVSDTKTANRSFLIDPNGRIVARYDKIHLFDVDLPSGETYRESNTVAGGSRAVLADLPWGESRPDGLLRSAFPATLSRARAERRLSADGAVCVHRDDGQGTLARLAACACHRERCVRDRSGTGRHPCKRTPDLWSFSGCSSVGRNPRRSRNRSLCGCCGYRSGSGRGPREGRVPNLRHDRAFEGP